MITVVINGQNYYYPEVGDTDWGSIATLAFDAITKTTLQPVKDLNDPTVINDFTLYNDIDFGPTHGLRVLFIQSRSNNPAATGVFRLAKDELVAWRNEDNDGDNTISFDADGDLIVNGVKVTLHGQIVNDDIAAGAGIEESKLALDHSTQSLYDNIENHKSDTANPHLTNLVNLVDTTIVTPAGNDTLLYDNNDSKWKNIPNTISNVSDVTVASVADGDVLVYDSNDSDWKNSDVVSSHVSDTNNPHNVTKAQILTGDLIVNADVDASAAIAESKLDLDYSTDSLNTAITSHTGNTSNPHSTSVSNLTDTTISTPTSGDVLGYDGSKWINTPSSTSSLSGLSDTDITTPSDGDVLVYDSVSTKWENSDELATTSSTVTTHVANTNNPHSTSVSNLTDTNVSSLNDSDILIYDLGDSEWKNTQLSLKRLVDTAISSEASGDALIYDGNDWINQENSVDNLTNVFISTPSDDDVLVYDSNGGSWNNQANTLDNLKNTTITTPNSGDTLSYNGSVWVNKEDSLTNLTDTTITTPSDQDTIVYDNNSSKWINQANTINNISNVSIDTNTLAVGDALVFDDQDSLWKNDASFTNHIGNTSNPHLTTVAKLTDTSIISPANNDVLLYDYANSQWVNSSIIEVNDIANINTATTAVTLTASDKRHQIFTATDGFNITLPSTGIKAGEKFVFDFTSRSATAGYSTPFAFYSSDNTLLHKAYCGFFRYEYTALVDTPTSSSYWLFRSEINEQVYKTNYEYKSGVSVTANTTYGNASGLMISLFPAYWRVDLRTSIMKITPAAGYSTGSRLICYPNGVETAIVYKDQSIVGTMTERNFVVGRDQGNINNLINNTGNLGWAAALNCSGIVEQKYLKQMDCVIMTIITSSASATNVWYQNFVSAELIAPITASVNFL